MCGSENSYIS